MQRKAEKLNTGLDKDAAIDMAGRLERRLGSTYLLALKTQAFHWNVTGPAFNALHELFERQYKALYEAGDAIAERIRALGRPAPASDDHFQRLSVIDGEGGVPKAMAMVHALAQDHEAMARLAREIADAAEGVNDIVTLDLATERAAFHEQEAWMLRSTLET